MPDAEVLTTRAEAGHPHAEDAAPREAPDASAEGSAPAVAPPPDPSVPGLWNLELAGARYTLALRHDASAGWSGSLDAEDQSLPPCVVDSVSLEGHSRFSLHCAGPDNVQRWFDVRHVDGVLSGRVAQAPGTPRPTDYNEHVTGWNQTVLDAQLFPRVWDLYVDGRFARLRIDRDLQGNLLGALKFYGSVAAGSLAEELERDIEVVSWDGAQLAFNDYSPTGPVLYTANASGRLLAGLRYDSSTGEEQTVSGERAQVLAYGLASHGADALSAWQRRTRAQLQLLAMAGAPPPATLTVQDLSPALEPLPAGTRPASRDDTVTAPQDYRRTEFVLRATVRDPHGGPDLTRDLHGMRAVPTSAAPPQGFPLVIVLNGHFGSAVGTFAPDNWLYWYGDAWAQLGFVVVAVDIGHRPMGDRGGLYTDLPDGDNPAEGNGTHPALRSAGFDPDFEEVGERTWDAQRALDYALTALPVDPRRVLMTGLSMGGETGTWASAMDTRVTHTLVSGSAPDYNVLAIRNNHPCWRWAYGNGLEYFEVSDLHALIAPRPLIVETGQRDDTFSALPEPFAGDKQVLRRSRVAWPEDSDTLVHYLHDDVHRYRMGGAVSWSPLLGVRVPSQQAPASILDTAWQRDATTRVLSPTVSTLLGQWGL